MLFSVQLQHKWQSAGGKKTNNLFYHIYLENKPWVWRPLGGTRGMSIPDQLLIVLWYSFHCSASGRLLTCGWNIVHLVAVASWVLAQPQDSAIAVSTETLRDCTAGVMWPTTRRVMAVTVAECVCVCARSLVVSRERKTSCPTCPLLSPLPSLFWFFLGFFLKEQATFRRKLTSYLPQCFFKKTTEKQQWSVEWINIFVFNLQLCEN